MNIYIYIYIYIIKYNFKRWIIKKYLVVIKLEKTIYDLIPTPFKDTGSLEEQSI